MTSILNIKSHAPEMIKMALAAPGFKDGTGDATPVFIIKEEPKGNEETDWKLRVTTFSDYKRVMANTLVNRDLKKQENASKRDLSGP